MEIKTSELIGPNLDWAVAKCEGALAPLGNLHLVGQQLFIAVGGDLGELGQWVMFTPSTDWAQGGPIIEREGIELTIQLPDGHGRKWVGMGYSLPRRTGPTALIAAMRCYVASKLGDEVDVPEELV